MLLGEYAAGVLMSGKEFRLGPAVKFVLNIVESHVSGQTGRIKSYGVGKF